jgi:methylthioribose-1-phosphate isomerase
MHIARERPLLPIWWDDDGLGYIDARRLPGALVRARAADAHAVIEAIRSSAVTGSGSVDLFAGFGAALARQSGASERATAAVIEELRAAVRALSGSCSALDRVVEATPGTELAVARRLLDERRRIDRAIAGHAAALLPDRSAVLTHGASGALTTGGEGTALGAIISACRAGKNLTVFITEAAPSQAGRRLAAAECAAADVPCTVVSDTMPAALMQTTPPACVLLGAEALAANGDVLAALGTYAIVLAAAHHRIPCYVALSRDAVDRASQRGDDLRSAPHDRRIEHEAFDVTPGRLITAVVTEYGIVRPPYEDALASLAARPTFALTKESMRLRS